MTFRSPFPPVRLRVAGALLLFAGALGGILPCAGAHAAIPPWSPAEVRGKLSLAWDAYESGLFAEALGYLTDVPPASPLHAEVIQLRADCLHRLGKYEDAVTLLDRPGNEKIPGWERYWEDVILAWAWDRTDREDYRGASAVLDRGKKRAPRSYLIEALARATKYRTEVRTWVGSGGEHKLSGGGDFYLLPPVPGATTPPTPDGDGWIQVCPPGEDAFWVSDADCTAWMPRTSEKMAKEGRTAWIRIRPEDFGKALRFEAVERGITVAEEEGGGLRLRRGENMVSVDAENWRQRAVLEGYGIRGAALMAVGDAAFALEEQDGLRKWVKENKGDLRVEDNGQDLVLSHARTGRTFLLEPAGWADVFMSDPAQWQSFWSDLGEELGRPARPYRCFCGREVVLREVLVPDGSGLVSEERGEDYAVVLQAHCPNHWSFVTGQILREWGVSEKEVFAEAKRQAVEAPWELRFERGEAEGAPYVLLAGPSASGLLKRPEVLLSVLESLEGRTFSGESVKVWAPTSETLIVGASSAAEEIGREGSRRAVSWLGGIAPWSGPLDYHTTVSLPKRSAGSCRLLTLESK